MESYLISETQLSAWEKLCEKATEGPWEGQAFTSTTDIEYIAIMPWMSRKNVKKARVKESADPKLYKVGMSNLNDAAFIAEARTAMPALIKAYREQAKLADQLLADAVDLRAFGVYHSEHITDEDEKDCIQCAILNNHNEALENIRAIAKAQNDGRVV